MSKTKKNNKYNKTNNYNKQRTIMSQNGYFKNGNQDPQIYNNTYDSENPGNLGNPGNTNIPFEFHAFNPPNFDTNFPAFNPSNFDTNFPTFNFANFDINSSTFNEYPPWLKHHITQVENQTRSIKKKDPKHYLNKALFYYYNQHPNFNAEFMPFSNQNYYDKLPQYYYDVTEKIYNSNQNKNHYKQPVKPINSDKSSKPKNWDCENF